MPTNRKYPLAQLMPTLEEEFLAGRPGNDFVIIEYVLLKGVNDSVEDAKRLVAMTDNICCMINLIVFNPHEGTQFEQSSDERVGVA